MLFTKSYIYLSLILDVSIILYSGSHRTFDMGSDRAFDTKVLTGLLILSNAIARYFLFA